MKEGKFIYDFYMEKLLKIKLDLRFIMGKLDIFNYLEIMIFGIIF